MRRTILAITAVTMLAACSDASPDGARISLSISTGAENGAAAANQGMFFSGTATGPISDGQNELVIEKAEVVLREIELERIETGDCDEALDDDACEEFEVGPLLLDLPLDGGTDHQVTIPIEPGTYDELEFDIHKVSNDDPEDAEFRAAHPDLVGISIRVQGTFNGDPFTFVTDLNVEQEFELNPPVVIDEETVTTNVTVRMDLAAWFRDQSGNLIHPAQANKGGEFESLVTENIKQNIEAFEDRDGDGDDQDES